MCVLGDLPFPCWLFICLPVSVWLSFCACYSAGLSVTRYDDWPIRFSEIRVVSRAAACRAWGMCRKSSAKCPRGGATVRRKELLDSRTQTRVLNAPLLFLCSRFCSHSIIDNTEQRRDDGVDRIQKREEVKQKDVPCQHISIPIQFSGTDDRYRTIAKHRLLPRHLSVFHFLPSSPFRLFLLFSLHIHFSKNIYVFFSNISSINTFKYAV